MFRQIRTSATMLLVLSVLTGLAYPSVITGLAQVVFSTKANGSLIMRNGRPVGSEHIGQPFDDPGYFWSRPSATGPFPYNAASSSGSNLGLFNPAQVDAITQRVKKLRDADPANADRIPVDLVTASASGLDPHISVAAARWQIARVAKARGMDTSTVLKLVDEATSGRQFGVLGEPVVNVLQLNLALEQTASAEIGEPQ